MKEKERKKSTRIDDQLKQKPSLTMGQHKLGGLDYVTKALVESLEQLYNLYMTKEDQERLDI